MDKVVFLLALIALVRCQVPPSTSEAPLPVSGNASDNAAGSVVSTPQTPIPDPPLPSPTPVVDPSPPKSPEIAARTAADLAALGLGGTNQPWNLFNKQAPYDLTQITRNLPPTPQVNMFGLPSGANSFIPKQRRRPSLPEHPVLDNGVELLISQLPKIRKHRFRRADLYHGNDPAVPHGNKGHWHPPKPPSEEKISAARSRPPPPSSLFTTGSRTGSSHYSMPPKSVLVQKQTELRGFTSKPARLENTLQRVSQAESRNRFPSHFSSHTKKQDLKQQQQPQQPKQPGVIAEPNVPAPNSPHPFSIYSEPMVDTQKSAKTNPTSENHSEQTHAHAHGHGVAPHPHEPEVGPQAHALNSHNQPYIPSPVSQSKPPYQEVQQSGKPHRQQVYEQQQQHQQQATTPAPPANGNNDVVEARFITMFDSWFQERFGNTPQTTTAAPPTILILRNGQTNKEVVTRLGPSFQLKPVIPNPNAAVKPMFDIRDRILQSQGQMPPKLGNVDKAQAPAGVDKKALFKDFMSMFKNELGGTNQAQPSSSQSQGQYKQQTKPPEVISRSNRGGKPVKLQADSRPDAGNAGEGQGPDRLGPGHANEPGVEQNVEPGVGGPRHEPHSEGGPHGGHRHEPISEAGVGKYPNEANPTERISEVPNRGPEAAPSPRHARRRPRPNKRPQTPAEAYFSGDPAFQPDPYPPTPDAHIPKSKPASQPPQPDPSTPTPEVSSYTPPPITTTTSAPGKRGRSRPTTPVPKVTAPPTEPTPRPGIDPDTLADINEARSYQGLPPLAPHQVDMAGNIKPKFRRNQGLFPNRPHPLRARRPQGGRRITRQHQHLHRELQGQLNPELHRVIHSLLRTKNNRRNNMFGNVYMTTHNPQLAFNPALDPDLMADLMEARGATWSG
ncbi:trithorax group protein osa-like isoform X1 [Mya arenaria]|uniref:trithorax group protein osa-like isoform X1 n=1 Tax=Mya arenaria TaxID=6604 RepID=UPI0022E8C45F|nr:trithorax group protein osa-like isoform X1 [Mya arenaria]